MKSRISMLIAMTALIAAPAFALQADEPAEPQATETEAAETIEATETMPAEASDESASTSDDELPQTASPLALIAALGAGATGAGLWMRARRRR